MNEQQFKEGLAPLLNILQVFVAAKKDDGKNFIEALNIIRKDENSIGKFNDLYERYGGSEEGSKPIINIRKRLIDKLIKDGSISISDLERFKDEEGKKYNHNIFKSRTNFGILHSIYYFYDGNKKRVLDFLGQLSKSILEDVGLDVKHREQAFDYNNHFGVDDFYIGFYNKTHDTWKTAIQFRVQSKGNNKLIVGLFKNRNFIKGKYNEYSLETVSYEDLINECNKYKEDVINDKMVNLIEYIKENIDHYSDIKEKAEQERKAFIDKFPLEKIKDLSLEEYNTGMGNANKGTFTWYLNTDFAISGRLFSNGQNRLFYKGEDGKYTYAKNMKDYLDRGNGDYNSAFQVYKDDLYNFIKDFDINTYDPEAFLSGAKYIKAALILMYKGDIFLTLGLVEVCVSIVKHLNLKQGSSINPRKADIIEYDLLITDYLKKEIPDIIEKYGYSALGKCVYDYYTNYLYTKEDKTEKKIQDISSTDNSLHSNLSTMIDLNTILYGVPGTGKTYNTINYAVAIIENKSIEEIQKEDRKSLKQRYEKYVKEGQILFTTFHQSFGYEDFIEGIKAEVKDDAVNYKIEDGIFKKLCKIAYDNYEDSNKDISELNLEFNIDNNVTNFLSNAVENNMEFKLKSGGMFIINEFNDEDIFLYNSSNAKSSTIKINIKKLVSILSSGKEFKYVGEIAEFLHGGTRWQEDSYYFTLYNEIKKVGNTQTKSITDKIDLKNYVLIIDEINRGNISKIFGELITLLEPDKRIGGKEELMVKLPYSHKEFGVPINLYVLGTMNTADRSIALIDLALRRRFKFKEIGPKSDLLSGIEVDGIDIKSLFESLNKKIEFLYDRDHLLGHAYFLPLKDEPTLDKLNSIMYDNIIPLLEEYFHDDREKIQLILGNGIINSENISPHDLGFAGTDYEEQIKYTINDNISANDYHY